MEILQFWYNLPFPHQKNRLSKHGLLAIKLGKVWIFMNGSFMLSHGGKKLQSFMYLG